MNRFITILLTLQLAILGSVSAKDVNLNGTWSFKTDVYNQGKDKEWFSNRFQRTSWDSIKVPSCWNTRLEYSNYTGVAWYATTFEKPQSEASEDVILSFGGVYNDVDVWLNGEHLGSHDFGFTEFSFDVTKLLQQTNELVLRVDNSFKLGATWNWGGIRRDVALNVLPKQRVENVFVTATPNLKNGSAEVMVNLNLVGQPEEVAISICDAQGKEVAKSNRVSIDNQRANCRFNLKNVNLWNFNTPYLYSVRVTSGQRTVEEKFGIREIKIDGYKLLINGVATRLNGANYVPYNRFTGNTLPEDIYKRDIDMMKECGVNMARLSHLPLPKDVLNYIDQKGILIIEEIPNWNKSENVAKDSGRSKGWLTELISQRYNHPCIIGWSAGNEIGRSSDNPELKEYLKGAFKHIKSLDSTRLAVYVTHTAGKQRDEPVLLSDMILYNQYGGHGVNADRLNAIHGGKPIFMSEYGTKINDDDINNDNIDISKMMNSMRGRRHLIGASIWTFNDYRSNYKDANTLATQNRTWGVVDAYGRKKRHFEVLQRENSPLKLFTIEKKGNNITLELQSRDSLDLPAFDVVGYSLRVTGVDNNGKDIVIKEQKIQPLKMSSAPLRLNVPLEQQFNKIYAELISPTDYVVHVAEQYLSKPSQPTIDYLESSDNAMLIYFERPTDAMEVYAIVKNADSEVISKSDKTIDNNILIKDLAFGKEFFVELVAVNGAGESSPSQPMSIKTQSAELPPVIVHLKQRDDNIEVGYTSSNSDYIYEFEYGTSADNLSRHIITTEFGACSLPVIATGETHYLRMRKRLRYGYASPWSRVKVVGRHTL